MKYATAYETTAGQTEAIFAAPGANRRWRIYDLNYQVSDSQDTSVITIGDGTTHLVKITCGAAQGSDGFGNHHYSKGYPMAANTAVNIVIATANANVNASVAAEEERIP